jgi:hypothetical protein
MSQNSRGFGTTPNLQKVSNNKRRHRRLGYQDFAGGKYCDIAAHAPAVWTQSDRPPMPAISPVRQFLFRYQ